MGFIFYWSGKTSTDRNESGVAFALRNGLLPRMSEDPKPVNDRFILLRFSFINSKYCTLITAYALSMTNISENISNFYDQLNQILHAILKQTKLFFLELASHIIPDQRFLESLKWRRIIPMSIYCYSYAQNTS